MKCCSFCCQGREEIDIWFSANADDLYICNAPQCMSYLVEIRKQYEDHVRPRRYYKDTLRNIHLEETIPDDVEDWQDYLVRKTKLEGTQVKLF